MHDEVSPVNRAQLQQLAEERVRDADALLNAGQWSGAYYLAGYAVEFGLKARIAKLTNQYDFPDKEFARQCFTHEIEALVKLGGLVLQRDADKALNPILGTQWQLVKDWDEEARYQAWTESQARKLFLAVADPKNGVLPWIKVHW